MFILTKLSSKKRLFIYFAHYFHIPTFEATDTLYTSAC